MAFKGDLTNDVAYINGIGRFDIEVNDEAAQVSWAQNGKPIPDDASMLKFERVVNGAKRSLIVKNCTKADFASYAVECGGEKKEAKLSAQSAFTEKVKDQQGKSGGIAVFECRVTPGSIVSWAINGKKINKLDFSILKFEERNVDDRAMLIVKNITNNEFTKYTAESRGEKCEAKLSQEGKSAPVMKPAARAKPPPPVIEIAPAENTDAFANSPTSISGKEGGIEVFECEMKDAAATCDWYKGDTKIDSSSFSILKFEAVVDGAKRKLIVKNINRKDAGEYSAKSGESSVSVKLSIGGARGGGLAVAAMPKRRGSVSDRSKEAAVMAALAKAKERNQMWIRHPNYLNLWIQNPDFVKA